jgi:hypothetical protein
VDNETKQGSPRCCTTRRDEKQRRLQLAPFLMNGLLLPGAFDDDLNPTSRGEQHMAQFFCTPLSPHYS